MSQEELIPRNELRSMEAALASLTPIPSRLNRDQLMFLAGQAATQERIAPRARHWLYPATTAGSLLLSMSLGFALWQLGQQKSRSPLVAGARSVALPNEAHKTGRGGHSGSDAAVDRAEDQTESSLRYVRLRNEVLAQGGDVRPSPVKELEQSSSGIPQGGNLKTNRELLREFLQQARADET